MYEEQSPVPMSHIGRGSRRIPYWVNFNEFVPFGDHTILCAPATRTEAAMFNLGFDGSIKSPTINSCLPATDDFEDHQGYTQQASMRDAVIFKDEGGAGPVFIRRADRLVNYKDSDIVLNGSPLPEWFSRQRARQIAREENLPFEER